ncbi:MAG TPA: hypothetical protein VKA78_06350 [Pyrinomonadaceae bacterium]|nr:hypothetical protein [Pyrinomonadaceae bacterium]
MKGYFTQLARRTGLRFTNAEGSIASRGKAVQPASPLHVEELTLIPPAVSVAAGSMSDERTLSTPGTFEAAKTQTDQPATASFPKSSSAEIQVNSVEHHEPESQQVDRESFQTFATERQSNFAEQNVDPDQAATAQEYKTDQIERVEVEFVPTSRKTTAAVAPIQETKVDPAAHGPRDVAVSELNEPVEREVLVRQYLREVRAWVAAAPTTEESVPESQSWSDRQPESVAFSVERQVIPAPAQPVQRDQIDVHDMSLSIGSISIVIEDPKPATAAVLAPAPTAPAMQPQTQNEPISLSRYYLRSW